MPHPKLIFWSFVVLALSCGRARAEKDLRPRIEEAARSAAGWKSGKITVYEEEELRRPACSFYTAGNDARLDTPLANYAVAGDEIIGTGDGATVAKILDTCAQGAGPGWSAQIVTGYHRNLGGGLVLRDETDRPGISRRMSASGLTFSPPAVDKDRLGFTFLLWDPQLNIVYRVRARRSAGGPVNVEKTPVLPAPR